ncbi:MAG: cytochrome c [Gammaproteobacteria bacterium]|nr:cytochrome c [Gammaproteobacteria bacterium]
MQPIIKKSFVFGLLCSALFAASHAALAADPENGKKLHQENCVTCHVSLTGGNADLLYTREDRSVASLSTLKERVDRCQFSLELQWFDEEIDDVAAFLNKEFYGFPKPK